MNKNFSPEEDDRLAATLQGWVVNQSLPPRFQEQVWNRIARAEALQQASFWAGLIRLLARSLQRPKVAYSYAAALLAFGIAAGSWTAQVKSNRLESDLGQRYLLSVDSYLQAVATR